MRLQGCGCRQADGSDSLLVCLRVERCTSDRDWHTQCLVMALAVDNAEIKV